MPCSLGGGSRSHCILLTMQADAGNNLIRRINIASRVVTTLAGNSSRGNADGIGTVVTFFSPGGVTMDPLGAFALVVRCSSAMQTPSN